MDLKPIQPNPQKEKPIKKEIGEYYDFPCPKCQAFKVKRYVYGYLKPNALSLREVPGGCCIDGDSPKWWCEGCGHEWCAVNY